MFKMSHPKYDDNGEEILTRTPNRKSKVNGILVNIVNDQYHYKAKSLRQLKSLVRDVMNNFKLKEKVDGTYSVKKVKAKRPASLFVKLTLAICIHGLFAIMILGYLMIALPDQKTISTVVLPLMLKGYVVFGVIYLVIISYHLIRRSYFDAIFKET